MTIINSTVQYFKDIQCKSVQVISEIVLSDKVIFTITMKLWNLCNTLQIHQQCKYIKNFLTKKKLNNKSDYLCAIIRMRIQYKI